MIHTLGLKQPPNRTARDRHKAVTGLFTFVAVDEHKQPVRILAAEPELPTLVTPPLES